MSLLHLIRALFGVVSHAALKGVGKVVCLLLVGALTGTASAQLAITSTTGSIFPYDSNKCATTQGPRAMYIGYRFANSSGTTQTNLKATLTTSGTGFGLAGGQVAEQYLGTLANGATRTLFWYVTYPCTDQTTGTMTVTVRNDATNALVQTLSGTYTTTSMLSANAGADPRLIVNVAGAAIGQIVSRDVTFKVGNIGSNNALLVQPAGNLDFDASCLQLIGTNVVSVNSVTGVAANTADTLYFSGVTSGGGQNNAVVMRYDFLYTGICTSLTNGNVKALPFSYSGSGTQIKYLMSDGATAETYFTFPPSTSVLTISKQVAVGTGTPGSSAQLFNGGTVTYTLTITNNSAFTTNLSKITDVLPTSPAPVTYVGLASGSGVTAANSMVIPTANTSSATQPTLVFRPLTSTSYQIAPNSSLVLRYTVTVPATAGTYLNSATAGVGTTTVYTTTTGTTPARATVVNVGPTNLGVSKSFSPGTIVAGNTTTLTLTVTNPNPVTASGVSLTDDVATTMGYATPMYLRVTANTCGGTVSAPQSADGKFTLTGGSVAANSSCAVTVAFTPWNPPVGTATNTIPAANVAATVAGSPVSGAALATATLTVTAGNAGGSYVCDPDFYQTRQDPTTLLSNLYKLDLSNLGSGGTAQWTEGFGPALNGLGYNPKDGHFYAVNITAFNSGSPFRLYRLGRSGAVEYANLTNIPAGFTIAAATIDQNGMMYIKPLNAQNNLISGGNVIYRYDLVTRAPAANLTLSANVYIWDLAVNPLDHQLYGSATPGGVYVINPATGQVTTRGAPATPATDGSNGIGTLFFNQSGVLYAYFNTGAFGTINLTTGAFTQTATASAAVQSDGGSCAFSSPNMNVVKTGAAFAKPSASLTYTLTVRNASTLASAQNVVLTDTLPAGTTYGASSGGGSYDRATGRVTWNLGTLAANATQSFTLTLTAPANAAAYPTLTNTASVTSSNESASTTGDNTASFQTRLVHATLGKTVANLTTASAAATVVAGLPNEVLEYCLSFANPGGADLPQYVVTDHVPGNVTALTTPYGGKAIRLTRGGTTTDLTSTAGDDAGTLTTSGGTFGRGTLTVNLGTLASGETGRVCFQTRIN